MVFQEIATTLKLLRMIWKVEELTRNSRAVVPDEFCFSIALYNLRSAANVPGVLGQPAQAHIPEKTAKLWNTPITASIIAVAPS